MHFLEIVVKDKWALNIQLTTWSNEFIDSCQLTSVTQFVCEWQMLKKRPFCIVNTKNIHKSSWNYRLNWIRAAFLFIESTSKQYYRKLVRRSLLLLDHQMLNWKNAFFDTHLPKKKRPLLFEFFWLNYPHRMHDIRAQHEMNTTVNMQYLEYQKCLYHFPLAGHI